MAGLFVVAGMVMIDRHRAKKEAKVQKRIYDDLRYAELQRETKERLATSSEASTPTSQRDSIFDPSPAPSETAERRSSSEHRPRADDVFREKARRRASWYGGNKEERPKWLRTKAWRSSVMLKH